MSRKIPPWLVVADGGFKCLGCGKVEPLPPLPMPVDAFQPYCEYVGSLHLKHKPAAGQPEPEGP